jgi:G:T/U-mismatch repair DNA glycosylase
VERIFCNGAVSYNLYQKYSYPITRMKAQKLPSTSPANAAWSLDRLTEAWRVIL